jgi:hypothetical protein
MRYLGLLLLLCSCVISPISPSPAVPAVAPVSHSLPAAVWPDSCVANWYAKAALPPCVESWITDITKQQKVIEAKHRKPHRKSIQNAAQSHAS